MMPTGEPKLPALYDSLWREALSHFQSRGVEVDPHLPGKERDGRRGLTLLARPAPPVRARVLEFLHRLKPVLPDQYAYTEASLHLTVLSLFTATEQFAPYYEQLPAYQRALEEVVKSATAFAVTFRGLTASPSSIMVQGFPHSRALNELRDALRAALVEAGLTRGLDTRYRLTTAHVTVLRFQRQPADIAAVQTALADLRGFEFGECVIERLELVKNDWYMSPEKTHLVAPYHLPPLRSGGS